MHTNICAPIAATSLHAALRMYKPFNDAMPRGLHNIHTQTYTCEQASAVSAAHKQNWVYVARGYWWLGVKQLIIKATAPAQRTNNSYNACFATSAARMHDCIALISTIAHTKTTIHPIACPKRHAFTHEIRINGL